MVKYKLSEPAEHDLRELYRYGVLTFGLDIANAYYDCLVSRFDAIAEHPELYQAVDSIRPGYRRTVCGVHSIYYRRSDEGILVMRILRSQNPDNALPD